MIVLFVAAIMSDARVDKESASGDGDVDDECEIDALGEDETEELGDGEVLGELLELADTDVDGEEDVEADTDADTEGLDEGELEGDAEMDDEGEGTLESYTFNQGVWVVECE